MNIPFSSPPTDFEYKCDFDLAMPASWFVAYRRLVYGDNKYYIDSSLTITTQ